MKKALIIVGAVLAVLILLVVVVGDSPDKGDDAVASDNGQAAAVTSRDNPMPMGETATIEGWEVTVIDTIENATDQVRAENPFNEAPAEGRQYFIATVKATFTGEGVDMDSSQFWTDVRTNVVDDNNVTYSALDNYCGVIPNPLEDASEVFVGGTVEGNLCWSVASDQVSTLVMFAEALFSFNPERTWFALR